MKTLPRLFSLVVLFLSLSFTAFGADTSRRHALEAQALLGPEVWSRVIRIENDQPSNRHAKTVYGLVFELAGILWFYDEGHGTQSFSLHKGRLTEEKADFAPLLRDIDAGFARWTVVSDRPGDVPARKSLRNGCFIESVAALRERLALGGEVVRPQLLSYYLESNRGLHGHTVLAYETDGHVEIIDSAQAGKRFTYPAPLAQDAMQLARAMLGGKVASARLLPLEPVLATGLFTAALAAGSPVANSE